MFVWTVVLIVLMAVIAYWAGRARFRPITASSPPPAP